MRRLGAVVAVVLILVMPASAFADVEARGSWHDSSDGTSGGVTLSFAGPGSAVSGSLRQSKSSVCELTNGETGDVEHVPVTVTARARVSGTLNGGTLTGTWHIGASDIAVAGDARCGISGDVSSSGSIEGRINFRRGRGSGLVDGQIPFEVQFEPLVDTARIAEAQAKLEAARREAAAAHARLDLQRTGVRSLEADLEAQRRELGRIATLMNAPSLVSRLAGEGATDGSRLPEESSSQERYLEQLGIVDHAQAVLEQERAKLAGLEQEAAAADQTGQAAADALKDAEGGDG